MSADSFLKLQENFHVDTSITVSYTHLDVYKRQGLVNKLLATEKITVELKIERLRKFIVFQNN